MTKIRDFIKRFKTEKELEKWLKENRKSYLYELYMQDTNYDGVRYKEITKKELKDIFLEEYYLEEEEKMNYI